MLYLMRCTSPLVVKRQTVGCGQCMPCRVNKSRVWTARILMEARSSDVRNHRFVTLTYDEDHLPRTPEGLPTLSRADGRRWRDSLGQALGGHPRFFFCGEYGGRTDRPHYHAILFNVPQLQSGSSLAWPDGFTSLAPFNETRARYVAQYVTSKWKGRADDPAKPVRQLEYSQMSRRPPLGDHFVLHKLVPYLRSAAGSKYVVANGDVPSAFRLGSNLWPLGDRHKRLMRAALDLPVTRGELVRNTNLRPELPEPFPSVEEIEARRVIYAKTKARADIFRSKTNAV